jgi:hypothetical protein
MASDSIDVQLYRTELDGSEKYVSLWRFYGDWTIDYRVLCDREHRLEVALTGSADALYTTSFNPGGQDWYGETAPPAPPPVYTYCSDDLQQLVHIDENGVETDEDCPLGCTPAPTGDHCEHP